MTPRDDPHRSGGANQKGTHGPTKGDSIFCCVQSCEQQTREIHPLPSWELKLVLDRGTVLISFHGGLEKLVEQEVAGEL